MAQEGRLSVRWMLFGLACTQLVSCRMEPGWSDRWRLFQRSDQRSAVETGGESDSADTAEVESVILVGAHLRFAILDEQGEPIPGRLTFMGDQGPGADLFSKVDVAPNELAIRKNVVYTLSGRGTIEVPPGRYKVYASRGLEWSVASADVVLTDGKITEFTGRLRHEVDTTGWISGDFHLHTLTFSGHGDSNLKERIISLVGEGVEFAVATDHNHNTDYGPTVRELGVTEGLTTITGNEVSTPIGHFNVFPLDPSRAIPNARERDARVLFSLIRQEENEFGVTPIIQLNHPRWGNIDYFGQTGLDPVTGVSNLSTYSDDFDTVELFNENVGWGYYDSDFITEPAIGSSRHWALRDWFNLLNRGHRYAAVGNSDSHTVYGNFAGYPRNFVRSETDDPGAIDPAHVVAALRNRQTYTTFGPLVDFTVNGEPMGGEVEAIDGRVELHIRIQAASWVDCDRVKVVVNGDVVEVIEVPDSREAVRLDTKHTLTLDGDSWIGLLVEGDDAMAPIVHDGDRPVRPLAIINPVWVDADGDGSWASPWTQAAELVDSFAGSGVMEAIRFSSQSPSMRGLTALAAAEIGHPGAAQIARRALLDDDRYVKLSGARAAEQLGDRALLETVENVYAASQGDPYLRVALMRATRSLDPEGLSRSMLAFIEEHGGATVRRYRAEVEPLLSERFVDAWMVAGYFSNGSPTALLEIPYGPEDTASVAWQFVGKNNSLVGWKEARSAAGGYLDLSQIGDEPEASRDAIAYAQTYLWSPEDRSSTYTLGSDDGCQLFVNGSAVFDDNGLHRADPIGRIGRMPLRRGWNRVLIKVKNRRGGFGLYFRVLDEDVRWSDRPA